MRYFKFKDSQWIKAESKGFAYLAYALTKLTGYKLNHRNQ